MTQREKFLLHAAVVVLLIPACGQTQPLPAVTPPTGTSRLRFTPEPASALIPTRTLIPADIHPPVDSGPFHRVAPLSDPLPNLYEEVQVRALADGSVWIITSQAVARWDGQAWNRVLLMEEDMLADVDGNGRLWLFRQEADEIAVWQDGQWTTYGTESGWTSARASTAGWWVPKPWRVSVGKDGTTWLPTEADVRRFDGRRWTIYTLEEMGFPSPEWEAAGIVHQIALIDGGAQVWVGECQYSGPGPVSSPGVRWFDGVTWRGADAPIGRTCVSVVELDPLGNVWIGARDALWSYQIDHQKWISHRLPEESLLGYNFAYTRDLIFDHSGDIWVILQYCGGASCDTISRLHRIHAGEWSQILDAQDWWFTPLKQLTLDGSGRGWLFWDGTVYELLGDEIVPMAVLAARGVDVSPDGTVWMVAGDEDDAALWSFNP